MPLNKDICVRELCTKDSYTSCLYMFFGPGSRQVWFFSSWQYCKIITFSSVACFGFLWIVLWIQSFFICYLMSALVVLASHADHPLPSLLYGPVLLMWIYFYDNARIQGKQSYFLFFQRNSSHSPIPCAFKRTSSKIFYMKVVTLDKLRLGN